MQTTETLAERSAKHRNGEAAAIGRMATAWLVTLVVTLVGQALTISLSTWHAEMGVGFETLIPLLRGINAIRLAVQIGVVVMLCLGLGALQRAAQGQQTVRFAQAATWLLVAGMVMRLGLQAIRMTSEMTTRSSLEEALRWVSIALLLVLTAADVLAALALSDVAEDAQVPVPSWARNALFFVLGFDVLSSLLMEIGHLEQHGAQWLWQALTIVESAAIYGLLAYIARHTAQAAAVRWRGGSGSYARQPTPDAVDAGRATMDLVVGGGIAVVGIVVTAVTYSASSSGSGGRFVVAWGAIVFGGLRAGRGAIALLGRRN